MCYVVYIATECPDDLGALSTDAIRFEKPAQETCTRRPGVFTFPHVWFVGSKAGCSCAFRHLSKGADALGFDLPRDWLPEEAGAVGATRILYDLLAGILSRGYKVSLLDCWSGDEDQNVTQLDVSLKIVPRDSFRMFEGHPFTLTA